MSEQIDYMKHDRKFLGWALINMMTDASTNKGLDFGKVFITRPQGSPLDVEIKINDVEVSFIDFMNGIEQQHRRMINEKALELIKEKFDGLDELNNSISTMVKDFIRNTRNKLGLEQEEDY